MGKAQQIERLWPVLSRASRVVTRALEGDESSLLRMKREAVFPESLREDVEDPAGILFPLKDDDEVIGVADHERAPLQPRLNDVPEPKVQDFVEEDVREDG